MSAIFREKQKQKQKQNLRCKGTNGCVLHIPKQVLHSYIQMQLIRIQDGEQYISY